MITRFVLTSITLVLSGVLALFQLPLDSHRSFLVGIASAGASLLLALVGGESAFVVLGAGLCLLPLFGPGVVNLFVIGFLLGYHLGNIFEDEAPRRAPVTVNREVSLLAYAAFIVPLLCGVIFTLWLDFDGLVVRAIFREGGVLALYDYLAASNPSWQRALATLMGYVVAGFLFLTAISREDGKRRFWLFTLGLAGGALASGAVTVLQIGGELPVTEANISPVWRAQGRFPSSFTDPNALGIMALVLIPLFIGAARLGARWLFRAAALSLALSSLYSGSRTLVMGLVLLGVLWFGFLVVRRRRLSYGLILAGGVLCGAMFIVLLGEPQLNEAVRQRLRFPSAERLLKTVNWRDAHGMFESRAIYTRLALSVWRQSPLIGFGVDRFYDEQRAAMQRTGIDIGDWLDNANNFYLQTLAEQGLFGFALLVFSLAVVFVIFLSPTSQEEERAVVRLATLGKFILTVFCVVSLTGPHIRFDEVRYVVFMLLAFTVSRPFAMRPEFLRFIRRTVLGFVLIAPPIFAVAVARSGLGTLSRGFYPVERVDGELVGWTVNRARLYLCDYSSDTVQLDFRALEPNLSRRRLRVLFYTGEEAVEEQAAAFEIEDNDWKTVQLRRPPVRTATTLVTIRTERLWSPRAQGMSEDPRWLGIVIRWPKEAC